MLLYLLCLLLMMIFIMQSVAFITLLERHLLGSSQIRLGPNKVSYMGILQALLDGLKLLKKTVVQPLISYKFSFLFLPGVTFILMYMEWFTLPYFYYYLTFEYSILFFFCLVGFSVYIIMIGGIVSFSKYSFLGSVRSASQSVSYEISFSFYVLNIIIVLFSLEFYGMFCLIYIYLYLPFLIMILAELNRAPFDFAEGESELVSGYNVEFSGIPFVLFFLGEYGSLIFFSLFFSVCFFGFSIFFSMLVLFIFVLIRSSYPRYRYDYMMNMFWFKFLPISLIFFFFYYYIFF